MEPEQDAPFFTICVTACGVGPYIAAALDSLKRQSLRDFEVLAMVEESPDDTEMQVRKMAEGDDRFRVRVAPRSGSPSVSRNYAIEHARGRYLLFVDGDDWLDGEALAGFEAAIRAENDPDILAGNGFQYLHDPATGELRRDKLLQPERRNGGEPLSGTGYLKRLEHSGRQLPSSVWLNAYSTEFLRRSGARFVPGLPLGEDTVWLCELFPKAERVVELDHRFYCYRRRPGSLTTGNRRLLADLNWELEELFRRFERPDFPEELRRMFASQWLGLFLWYHYHPLYAARFSEKERKQAYLEWFGSREKRRRFAQVVRSAPRGKRLLFALLELARFPGMRPVCRLLFTRIYFRLRG